MGLSIVLCVVECLPSAQNAEKATLQLTELVVSHGYSCQRNALIPINSFNKSLENFTLTEVQCKVENCVKCKETSGSTCDVCQTDYVLADGLCKNKSKEDGGLTDTEIAGIYSYVKNLQLCY